MIDLTVSVGSPDILHSKKKWRELHCCRFFAVTVLQVFPWGFSMPETVCIVLQLIMSIKLKCPLVVSELKRSTNKTERYL